MKTILVVEDDKDIISLLSFALKSQNYQVIEANDGQEGYEQYRKNDVDLVITDAMMPNIDGYQLVKLIRIDNKSIPIIMLTALKSDEDEINSFDSGVNDFVSKPFSIDVLMRRIENQFSASYEEQDDSGNKLYDGSLVIDLDRYCIYVNEIEVKLTKKEFLLLVELVENHGKVMTREKLVQQMWGEQYFGDNRNIDTHVKNLRKKINNDRIRTIKGIGYMYEKENK